MQFSVSLLISLLYVLLSCDLGQRRASCERLKTIISVAQTVNAHNCYLASQRGTLHNCASHNV